MQASVAAATNLPEPGWLEYWNKKRGAELFGARARLNVDNSKEIEQTKAVDTSVLASSRCLGRCPDY